jgi:hypothetical protein
MNPNEPPKKVNSGRPRVNPKEAAADLIRYHFHLILV